GLIATGGAIAAPATAAFAAPTAQPTPQSERDGTR
ncbi:phytochelatin synthase, partial [Salinispora sp. H7-4]|nr:phytochelatin synthase [Salinispora sp. H7-4]